MKVATPPLSAAGVGSPLQIPLEPATHAELKDRPGVELLVREVSIHRNFHLGLDVDPLAHHHGCTGARIYPVPTADYYRRAVEDVLFPVKPVGSEIAHDAMCAYRAGPPTPEFPRRASAEPFGVLRERRACGEATYPAPSQKLTFQCKAQ